MEFTKKILLEIKENLNTPSGEQMALIIMGGDKSLSKEIMAELETLAAEDKKVKRMLKKLEEDQELIKKKKTFERALKKLNKLDKEISNAYQEVSLVKNTKFVEKYIDMRIERIEKIQMENKAPIAKN